MAKKQVDGDGLDIPNRIKALPVKRTGPIVAAIIVALFAAMLVQALVTNPRFEWNVVWKYLFNENVLEGIKYTLLLTVISMVIAIILAVVLAVMRKSINPVLRGVSWFYIWFFRGTPVYTQLVFWGAGLEAVDPGQTEAAKALGMKRTLIMRRIVLPQAMRIIIPPTGNEFIGMLKTTSLVNAVPFTLELQFATTAIATRLYKPIPLLIVACIWYLVITSILMVIQSRLEKHFGKGFDARPAGARGKRTPLPGKTFGEPKDDIDKQNEATFAGMTA